MHDLLQRIGHRLVTTVYPPGCIACGAAVQDPFGLCAPCWAQAGFITGLACDSCGAPLPGHSDGVEHCDACLRDPPVWSRGRAVLSYEETGKRLILALKHGDRTELARPMGKWLATAGRDLIRPDTLIAPIPLHRLRLLRRRYNQAALLSHAVARHTGAEHMPMLLRRNKATPCQNGRDRAARYANLNGALEVRATHRALPQGRSVLLVDDVMTSGATLTAASRAVLQAGAARVDVLVVARVANDG